MRWGCILIASVLAALSACASQVKGGDEALATARPGDLTIEATVTLGPGNDGFAPSTRRFVMFPDGAIHYSPGPGRGLPLWRRTLTAGQMDRLWSLARELPASGAGPSEASAAPGETNYRIEIAGGGERRVAYCRFAPDGEPDPAIHALIETLATLAWADETDEISTRIPRRYDFGDDPYARYRSGDGGNQ